MGINFCGLGFGYPLSRPLRMGPSHIYTLIDPESYEIRYVGYTSLTISERLSDHVNISKNNSHRSNWIHCLKKRGLRPMIRLVQDILDSDWSEAERYWVSYFKGAGCDLVNGNSGGTGKPLNASRSVRERQRAGVMASIEKRRSTGDRRGFGSPPGFKHTEETKRKISLLKKGVGIGRHHSEETKKKIGNGNRGNPTGYKHSEETIRKIAASSKGRKLSPESIEKIRQANIGRKNTPESIEKMRIARLETVRRKRYT